MPKTKKIAKLLPKDIPFGDLTLPNIIEYFEAIEKHKNWRDVIDQRSGSAHFYVNTDKKGKQTREFFCEDCSHLAPADEIGVCVGCHIDLLASNISYYQTKWGCEIGYQDGADSLALMLKLPHRHISLTRDPIHIQPIEEVLAIAIKAVALEHGWTEDDARLKENLEAPFGQSDWVVPPSKVFRHLYENPAIYTKYQHKDAEHEQKEV